MLRIFVFLFAFLLISCSEESSNGTDPNDLGLGSFEVKIDGASWVATSGFVFAGISSDDSTTSAVVTASKGGTSIAESFGIGFSNLVSGNSNLEGTYSLGGLTAAGVVFTKPGENLSYISMSGQLVVSEITSTNVAGTFNAVCLNTNDVNDTLTMTDGAFNAAIVAIN